MPIDLSEEANIKVINSIVGETIIIRPKYLNKKFDNLPFNYSKDFKDLDKNALIFQNMVVDNFNYNEEINLFYQGTKIIIETKLHNKISDLEKRLR